MARRTTHGLVRRMIAAMVALMLVYAVVVGAALLVGVGLPVVVTGAGLAVLTQWWATEWLARSATRAQLVTPAEAPEPHAVLDRLCALGDLPKPRLAISPSPVPNAFTLGRSRRHTTVVVTRGLLEALNPDELSVALAHEVAHIRHRDVTVMTLASSPAIALAWGTSAAGRFIRRNSSPTPFLTSQPGPDRWPGPVSARSRSRSRSPLSRRPDARSGSGAIRPGTW